MESRKVSQRAVAQRLESLARAGVEQIGRGRVPAADGVSREAGSEEAGSVEAGEVVDVAAEPVASRSTSPTDSAPPALGSDSGDSPLAAAPGDSLAVIEAEVAACTACGELASTRTQTVFGVGDPRARLCFLGEAPGADEDRQGEPFVGRAGQLLTKIIEACTLRREQVYILNVLKCRPPGNRNPLPSEAAACRGFLDRQLAQIRPDFICCLGAVAAQNLLQTEKAIGKLRGEFHEYRGIRVVCTYHPAYLLRNPAAKRHTWEDMKMLMRAMGIELG